MIRKIKNILGVDKEIESLDARINRLQKGLLELQYKVADLDVIVTFLNELRRNNNEKQ